MSKQDECRRCIKCGRELASCNENDLCQNCQRQKANFWRKTVGVVVGVVLAAVKFGPKVVAAIKK